MLTRLQHKISARFIQFYHDHIDPDGIQPLQAVRTAIAGVLAIFIYHALPWTQSYWVVLAAILLLQTYAGNTPRQKITALFITTLLATLCTYIASRLCGQLWALALFLCISTFISVYCYVIDLMIGTMAVYMNIFCLCAGALAVDATDSWQRAICVGLGGCVAIVVCGCVWPERLSKQIRDMLHQLLYRLADFNRVLLENSHENTSTMIRRNRLLRGLQLSNKKIPPHEIQTQEIVQEIENCYEILLQLHQLYRRLETENNLCFLSKELHLILHRSTWLLFSTAQQVKNALVQIQLEKFMHIWRTFEDIYQQQYTKFSTAETLIFVAYIDGMHKLKNHITLLMHLLTRKFSLP